MYCTFCGSKNVSQLTSLIIVMQLPGAAVDVAGYGCSDCSKRWFVEYDLSSHQADPADTESTVTESVQQPEIKFCEVCGTPIGCR